MHQNMHFHMDLEMRMDILVHSSAFLGLGVYFCTVIRIGPDLHTPAQSDIPG